MHVLVLGLLLLLALDPTTLERTEVAATLETEGSDQSLDFGSDERESPINYETCVYIHKRLTPWCKA